jgi:hypothetical protein
MNQTALSGLDPVYLSARRRLAAGKIPKRPISKRRYGRTNEKLSISRRVERTIMYDFRALSKEIAGEQRTFYFYRGGRAIEAKIDAIRRSPTPG